jgi:hypothetical protein
MPRREHANRTEARITRPQSAAFRKVFTTRICIVVAEPRGLPPTLCSLLDWGNDDDKTS